MGDNLRGEGRVCMCVDLTRIGVRTEKYEDVVDEISEERQGTRDWQNHNRDAWGGQGEWTRAMLHIRP